MKIQNTPLSESTVQRIFTPWLEIVKLKETGSVINIPKRDQVYRVYQFADILELQGYRVVALDLTSGRFDDPSDINMILPNDVNKVGYKTLLVIDADILLSEKKHLISYFENLYHRGIFTSIIFFFQKNIIKKSVYEEFGKFSVLYRNTSVFGLISQSESMYFIEYLSDKFSLKLDSITQLEIVNACGGSMWLIKEAVRYLGKTKDIYHLFNHPEMMMRLEVLSSEMDEVDRNTLFKLLKNFPITSEEEKESLRFLVKTNLVKKSAGSYVITIPIFANYLKNSMNEKFIAELSNTGSTILSRRERIVLRLLLKKRGSLVSRDELAKLIWKDTYAESYTDWALDQFMRRLRNKLQKLGFHKGTIETKRNLGFTYSL